MKNQKTYEYVLPQDNTRLIIDATVFAGLDAIHDGPNTMSLEIIEEKARRICEQFKTHTKSAYATNDFDLFYQIIINNYTQMYIEKQKIYAKDITAHEKEVQLSKQYEDFIVRYRIFVERSVMQGGHI
jgi:hypothetical protein